MKARKVRQAEPRIGNEVGEEPFLDFTSGYVQRALHKLPKQGDRKPWKLHQNYAPDLMAPKFGTVDDSMEFSNPEPAPARAALPPRASSIPAPVPTVPRGASPRSAPPNTLLFRSEAINPEIRHTPLMGRGGTYV